MSELPTFSTREVADKLGTDPHTLRRYLRAKSLGVGAGNRYTLAPAQVPALQKSFNAWKKADEESKSAKGS